MSTTNECWAVLKPYNPAEGNLLKEYRIKGRTFVAGEYEKIDAVLAGDLRGIKQHVLMPQKLKPLKPGQKRKPARPYDSAFVLFDSTEAMERHRAASAADQPSEGDAMAHPAVAALHTKLAATQGEVADLKDMITRQGRMLEQLLAAKAGQSAPEPASPPPRAKAPTVQASGAPSAPAATTPAATPAADTPEAAATGVEEVKSGPPGVITSAMIAGKGEAPKAPKLPK